MTSKQRSYLKGLAMTMDPIFQFVKISILKNCLDDPKEVANTVAERTRSQVVQVIGKKFVLYKPFKENPKIILPK